MKDTAPCKVRIEADGIHVNGVHTDRMLAYPLKAVALLLGISYWTVRREVLRRKLARTTLGLISRDELHRYLKQESKPPR